MQLQMNSQFFLFVGITYNPSAVQIASLYAAHMTENEGNNA